MLFTSFELPSQELIRDNNDWDSPCCHQIFPEIFKKTILGGEGRTCAEILGLYYEAEGWGEMRTNGIPE